MKLHLLLFVLAVSVLHAGRAHATHKNWVLKDYGSECTFAVPSSTQVVFDYEGALINPDTFTRGAYCPVALAARWGSTGGTVGKTFAPFIRADAMSAIVYGGEGFDTGLSCQAQMQAADGSMYFSGTVTGTGGVAAWEKIVLAQGGHWVGSGGGNDLEANENITVKSLNFFCNVPYYGHVNGTKVRLCQANNVPDCDDPDHPDEELLTSGIQTGVRNFVQISGIECIPKWNQSADLVYNDNGLKNNSTTEARGVVCAMTPPSSDTLDNARTVRYTRVYYSGGSTAVGCVSQGTCPSCYLGWRYRSSDEWVGNFSNSLSNFVDNLENWTEDFTVFQGFIPQELAPGLAGQDVNLYLSCQLPPQVTLRGVTSQVDISGVQNGT